MNTPPQATQSQDRLDAGLTGRMQRRQLRRGWLIDQETGERSTALRRNIVLHINKEGTVATINERVQFSTWYIRAAFVIDSTVVDAIKATLQDLRREGWRDARNYSEAYVLDILAKHAVEVPVYSTSWHITDLSRVLLRDGADQFIQDEQQRDGDRHDQLAQLAKGSALPPTRSASTVAATTGIWGRR